MILTNEHRHYLGLSLIAPDWDIVPFNEEKTLVFDGNIIRKVITNRVFLKTYREEDVEVETAENRTIVLPKTSKGKPKKLNSTIIESFTTIGIYFRYTGYNVSIGSSTSQHSFFTERHADIPFEVWFEAWKNNFTQADFQALEAFKNQPRTYQKKYKEGDVFRFKIGKNQYGFGKILINVVARRKDENFKKIKIMV